MMIYNTTLSKVLFYYNFVYVLLVDIMCSVTQVTFSSLAEYNFRCRILDIFK